MKSQQIKRQKTPMFGMRRALIQARKDETVMTVILVLTFFVVFIALDYFLNKNKAIQTVPVASAQPVPASFGGGYVDGFQVPENISYHAGHTWLVRERKNVVRIGADEFAAALLGKVDQIELPKPGQWVRQGQKVLAFSRGDQKTGMVSPTEGEVMEINTELVRNPAALRNDPYGKSWLMVVHVPDEENTNRNLVPKGLVREWMRDAVERLYSRQPALAGAVAADGGRPAEDVLAGLPGSDWKEAADEFFLTA
jgi:glycine cleavage system H protein